jgi:hypothetical protein
VICLCGEINLGDPPVEPDGFHFADLYAGDAHVVTGVKP